MSVEYGGPIGPWASTDRLALDGDGILWLRATEDLDERPLDPRRPLGPIESADVDEDLVGELAELLAAWREAASRSEDVRDLWSDYWATRGPC